MNIEVITFTETERAAVDFALDELVGRGWGARTVYTTGMRRIRRDSPHRPDDEWMITHNHAGAQGNTVVAATVAGIFRGRTKPGDVPDYAVFYGCAGAVNPQELEGIFLVDSANYLSLGGVRRTQPGCEQVRLKNKWLSDEVRSNDGPLPSPNFPLVGHGGTRDLTQETGFPPARVLATDSVVYVSPATTPPPDDPNALPRRFSEDEWTYADAMAFMQAVHGGSSLLVEMEAYGIAMTARALALSDRVVVMRVATDALEEKDDTTAPAQGALLMRGRVALLELLGVLFNPSPGTSP